MTLLNKQGRNKAARQAGFTLLEMIVVIVIMGLTLALLTNFRQPRSHWLETRVAGQQVAEAMRDARGAAIAQGQPVALALPHLPAWLPVAVQAPLGGIVFSPDGSASGGSVLLGSTGQQIEVAADWLTGRVQIDTQ